MKFIICLLLALVTTWTIYDEDWHRKGYVTEKGTIYDKDWKTRGHIRKDGWIYDQDWNRKGKIEKGGTDCLNELLK